MQATWVPEQWQCKGTSGHQARLSLGVSVRLLTIAGGETCAPHGHQGAPSKLPAPQATAWLAHPVALPVVLKGKPSVFHVPVLQMN